MCRKPALSLIFLLCALFGVNLHAQTAASENNKLKQYNNKVSELKQANKNIATKLTSLQKSLPDLRSILAAAEKERNAAKAELDKASEQVKQDPSQLNKGRLDNARFKQLLVKRKYDDANSNLQKATNEIAHLKTTLAANQHHLQSLHSEIADERALIARLAERERNEAQQRKEQAAAAKADDAQAQAQVEKLRKEHEAAVKEIERLKAMLAKKEAADKSAAGSTAAAPAQKPAGAAVTAAAKSTAAASATVAAVATTATTTKPVAAKPAATASSPAPASAPAPKKKAVTAPVLVRVSDSDGVHTEMQRAEKLAARGGSAPDKILHIRRLTRSGLLRSDKTENLRYLGGGQYYGYTRVGSGPTDLVVGSDHWHTKFANSFTTFVFILDDRDANHPRLVLFDRALSRR